MASQTQIAKMALSHFGDRFDISVITEQSTEAEAINLVYDDALRAVLRAHDWNFARSWTSPAYLTTPVDASGDIDVPSNWSYMFTYPTDAAKVLKLVNPLGDRADPLQWTVGRNGNDVKVLLCNEEEPEVEYTKIITDTSEFDSMFVMALSYYLASMTCMNLTGNPSLAGQMMDLYRLALVQAAAEDGNEGEHATIPEAEWIKARV